MASAEILAVLADEVADAHTAMATALAGFSGSGDSTDADARTVYLEQVQRIGAASGALGLIGLQRVCSFIEQNLTALGTDALTEERRELFARWPEAMLDYLNAPRDTAQIQSLTGLLNKTEWPSPL